jgi:hypothetical protein
MTPLDSFYRGNRRTLLKAKDVVEVLRNAMRINVHRTGIEVLNYARSRIPSCARTYAETNPSAQRATQLSSVLARVCSVSRQNRNTTTVP